MVQTCLRKELRRQWRVAVERHERIFTMVIGQKKFHCKAFVADFGSYLAEKFMNNEMRDEIEETKDEGNSGY